MIAIFDNIEIADQADNYVGDRLEKEGQKENPRFKCNSWCGTEELPDGRGQMVSYHKYLENFKNETGNDFELVDPTSSSFVLANAARGAYLIMETTHKALEDAFANEGDPNAQLKIIYATKDTVIKAAQTFAP